LLLFGTAVYNGSIVLFADEDYTALDEEADVEVKPETELAMGPVTRSPQIMRDLRKDDNLEMTDRRNYQAVRSHEV
jgi:hypothetical protein